MELDKNDNNIINEKEFLHNGDILSIKYYKDKIYTASINGYVYSYDLKNENIEILSKHELSCTSIEIKNNILLSAGIDGMVYFWSLEAEKTDYSLNTNSGIFPKIIKDQYFVQSFLQKMMNLSLQQVKISKYFYL
jgi:WD40 repeat protein